MAAAATLALLVGSFLIVAGLLRLGFLANFISDPVLTGFKAGVGLLIVVDQVPKLLGVHIERGHFFRKLLSIAQHVPEANRATLILAATMLAILFGMKRLWPRMPAPLVAVIVGIAAAELLGLKQAGVALTGFIPADSSAGTSDSGAAGKSVARCVGDGAHVLYGVHRCRPRVCKTQ